MKKDASRFSPKGVLFHRTFFTAPFYNRSDIFYLSHAISKLSGVNLIIKKPAVNLVKYHTYAVPYEG